MKTSRNVFQRIVNISLLIAAILFSSACAVQKPKVNNVIYIIGDGMGFGPVSVLAAEKGSAPSFMEKEGIVTGISTTFSASSLVTDSSAGGTALATGTKTDNGKVSISPQGDSLVSIMKKAHNLGKTTGIIVSTSLYDATPAVFYANVDQRSKWEEIALQMSESSVDILMGEGMKQLVSRKDGRDLTKRFTERGYKVTSDFEEVKNMKEFGKTLAIVPMDSLMRPVDGSDFLTAATSKTLELLKDGGSKGFFLMVESSNIDHFCHQNDGPGLREEMIKFDHLAKAALAYADANPGTLVVITADHETGSTGIYYGGKVIFGAEGGEKQTKPAGHTGNAVPIFAYGPGSERFMGFKKNTDIPAIIESLMRNE